MFTITSDLVVLFTSQLATNLTKLGQLEFFLRLNFSRILFRPFDSFELLLLIGCLFDYELSTLFINEEG